MVCTTGEQADLLVNERGNPRDPRRTNQRGAHSFGGQQTLETHQEEFQAPL